MIVTGEQQIILVIDPGRAKCGVAVVSGPDPVITVSKAVVESQTLVRSVTDILASNTDVARIVIGSGTGSGTLRRALKSAIPNMTIDTIDEHRSSERARTRYLEQNIPTGWQRLVPPTLRTPDRPYDDYVAVILAEDYFLNNTQGS